MLIIAIRPNMKGGLVINRGLTAEIRISDDTVNITNTRLKQFVQSTN